MSIKSKLFENLFNPETTKGFVLPDRIRSEFPDDRIEGNYLFHGTPGSGKSALAISLGKNYDTYYFRASIEGTIDALRKGSDLYDFCSTTSLISGGKRKVVILDELNGVSRQFFEALKGFIDKFKEIGVVFIGTTNYIEDVETAIISRMKLLDFNLMPNEEEPYRFAFETRIKAILSKIDVSYDQDGLDALINRSYPDWRGVLQDLQYLHRSGIKKIDPEVIKKDVYQYNALFDLIAKGNFRDPQKWLPVIREYQNPLAVIQGIERELFDYLNNNHPSLSPNYADYIIIIAKYVDMVNRRVEPTICLRALMAELMKRTFILSNKPT